MYRKILALSLIILILFISPALAQEEQLPDPGITPDSWMYGFKRFGEALDMAFTFDEAARAQKHLRYASLRLSEAKAMANGNMYDLMESLVSEFENGMDESENDLDSAGNLGINVTMIREAIAEAQIKHWDALEEFRDRLAERAQETEERIKDKVSETINKTLEMQERVMNRLENESPVKTAELHIRIAEKNLVKAQVSARERKCELECNKSHLLPCINNCTRNSNCGENDSSCITGVRERCSNVCQEQTSGSTDSCYLECERRIEDIIDEYGERINKSLEIADSAREKVMNETIIMEIVGNATSSHLSVLQEVYENVPERAKPAIKQAINVSATGQNTALRVLERDAPGIAERVQNTITERVMEIKRSVDAEFDSTGSVTAVINRVNASVTVTDVSTAVSDVASNVAGALNTTTTASSTAGTPGVTAAAARACPCSGG